MRRTGSWRRRLGRWLLEPPPDMYLRLERVDELAAALTAVRADADAARQAAKSSEQKIDHLVDRLAGAKANGVTAADVVAAFEMILGRAPDEATVEQYLTLGIADRAGLGRHLIATDEFRSRRWHDLVGGDWAQRVWRANERKKQLLSFGPNACGVLVTTKHGLFAVDPEDGGVSALLLLQGYYNEPEYELAKSFTRKTGDVLVIGAHIGTHAVPLSRDCAELVAIEANPRSYEFLSANLALNRCNNAITYNVAAGDKAEKTSFLLNRDNSGGSKRLPHHPHAHYLYDDPEMIEVRSEPLDQLLGPREFSLITMDIEGSEYFALQGMPEILNKSAALSIEFLPHHLRDVANVQPEEWARLLLPHFNFLYVPETQKILQKHAIIGETKRMYDAGEQHDYLYFLKELPPAAAVAIG